MHLSARGKVGGIVGRGKLKRAPRLRFEARGEVEKLSSAIIHREREERERERGGCSRSSRDRVRASVVCQIKCKTRGNCQRERVQKGWRQTRLREGRGDRARHVECL